LIFEIAILCCDNERRDARVRVKENITRGTRNITWRLVRDTKSREIFDSRTFTRVHSGTSTEKRSSSGRRRNAISNVWWPKDFYGRFHSGTKVAAVGSFNSRRLFTLYDCTVTSYHLARNISDHLDIAYIAIGNWQTVTVKVSQAAARERFRRR